MEDEVGKYVEGMVVIGAAVYEGTEVVTGAV
jgi:hypothetical protein